MSVEARIARVRESLAAQGLDALLVRGNANLRWLTGLSGIFDEEQAHAALITSDTLRFHTDMRYAEMFSRRLAGTDWQVDARTCAPALFFVPQLADAPRRIGIEDDMPLHEFRALEKCLSDAGRHDELVETHDLLFGLRSVKDAEEVSCLKASQQITDAAFAHICDFMRPGLTEREVALELEFFMRSQGAEGLAFPSIVAGGARGASPHSLPSDAELVTGDLVVLDFGARLNDYCSDMTRTVCMGRPSERQREVYETVRDANARAKDFIVAGAGRAEAHELVVRLVAEAGYAGRFTHALGHGVGIDIHELPVLAARTHGTLVEGNVVTDEPGIYLPGEFGVRIEDFGVVREDGFDVFTTSPHELMVL
jgi:Xaa-Pro aminopeptidase